MSLRDQLNTLLPSILPSSPFDSIKGTELIRLLKLNLQGNYSDASLRYHFSIISCDPYSAIAKVEKGQGYYRREDLLPPLSHAQEMIAWKQGRLEELGSESVSIDAALLRVRKFRAVVTRYYELNGRFPFLIRKPFEENSTLGNLWRYPDLVLVDWEMGETVEEEIELNPVTLRLKQSLGIPPFRLCASRLRLTPSLNSYREDFFQTLSVSQWAQGGELIYAGAIQDEALADGLRKLSATFGLGVCSFGLSAEVLDELPSPAHILSSHPKETEAIMTKLEIQRIGITQTRPNLDWSTIASMRAEYEEIDQLMIWISDCMEKGTACPFKID